MHFSVVLLSAAFTTTLAAPVADLPSADAAKRSPQFDFGGDPFNQGGGGFGGDPFSQGAAGGFGGDPFGQGAAGGFGGDPFSQGGGGGFGGFAKKKL